MGAFARLHPRLQEKIVHRLGWNNLRPVQEQSIETILDGKNSVILAPTAGGKTEAALFPTLSGCLTNQEQGLRTVYVCPTRALLNNQEERISEYAEMVALEAFKWHGDVSASSKKSFIKEPSEVLLTTPESLEVMLISSKVQTAKLFKHVRYVIIDEVHALASCDRGNHLISVLERIRAYAETDFQRIGLSATVGNPSHILEWLQGSSNNPQQIVDPPREKAKKHIEIRWVPEPEDLTIQAINDAHGKKSLFFCESRRLVENVSRGLKQRGDYIYAHHSSLSREERELSEAEFKNSRHACIVSTSTMELGIDIGDLDKVLQVDAPSTVSSFMQRLGRTGRREGTIANTTFFVQKEQKLLQAIAIVELAREGWIENVPLSQRAWHLLLHQIMALCLERGAVTRQLLWDLLHSSYCLSAIRKEEFDSFLTFLREKEFLHDDGGGAFSMGLDAEKVFGRRNFMEIYSVFSSPIEFEVMRVSGDVIGTVQWDFLEKLLEEEASFYLSGKAWAIERIEWKKKRVYVFEAPAGKVPKWESISPRFLGYELCRKMRDVLVDQEELPYLDTDSREILKDLREDRRSLLSQGFAPIEYDNKGMIWWTYAGGNINNTLRAVFTAELGEKVIASNEYLKVVSDTLRPSDYDEVIKKVSRNSYWESMETKNNLLNEVPNYHLSKFQPYLPEQLQYAIVAETVYDIGGTLRFIRMMKTDFEN